LSHRRLDSIPKLRRSVLDYLERCYAPAIASDIAEAVEHPTTTTGRALEDLTVHRVTVRHGEGRGYGDRWNWPRGRVAGSLGAEPFRFCRTPYGVSIPVVSC
jgi:hypothetical protein